MGINIAIVAPSSVPFQVGGAEKFWLGMRQALADVPGHFVELIKLPAKEATFADIIDSYHKFHELDLAHFDLVITSKYPAWMIRHGRHVLYFQHPLRGLYDTYHFTGLPKRLPSWPEALNDLVAAVRVQDYTPNQIDLVFDLCRHALAAKNIPSKFFDFPGPLIREVVHFFDRAALDPSRVGSYLSIAKNACSRPGYPLPAVDIKCLHHPSDLANYLCGPGKYIFTASRLNSMKRLHLVIKAMAFVQENITLKIAGTGPELEHLRQLAGGDKRIEFLGHVPDSELTELYAGAICVPFVPYDEDYGLITLEAMKSGKPVVCATDSGGPSELVKSGETGFVVEPNPRSLGEALNRLAANPALAQSMGEAARKSVEHITWPNTVGALLLHAANASSRGHNSRKIVICAPFAPDKAGAGGQRRLAWMCEALASEFDVLVVRPGAITQPVVEDRQISGRLREISLPWPKEAIEEAQIIRRKYGFSGDDLAFLRHCETWDELLQTLSANCRQAICVILSHPWLYPAVKLALPHIPHVYDAHNVEANLKSAMFGPESLEAKETMAVEMACAKNASLVFACCDNDAAWFSRLRADAHHAVHLLPNGYDSDAMAYMDRKSHARLRERLAYPQSRLALFTGSGHAPNQQAAAHIIKMAYNLPEVEFLIVGTAGTQEAVRRLPRPANVHLVGVVDEKIKNVLLGACDVALNPVTTGSGTNLKIIEYLGAGLPTVSTPFGMRGIQLDCGQAVQIVPLEEFPEAIRRVLNSPPSSDVMSAVAKLVREGYSWHTTMEPACKLIKDIVTTGQP